MNKLLWCIVVVFALAAGVVANWLAQKPNDLENQSQQVISHSEVVEANTVIEQNNYRSFLPAKDIAQFALQRADSDDLTNKDLLGKWSFVVFGYTYCPDVCPTTLARLKSVYRQLKQAADVQIIFVSADPLRDDLTRLGSYIGYFEPEFVGVTSSHDKLFPFAQSLLLPYGIVAQATSDDYAVSHSASIALINPQGKLYGQFKPSYQVGKVPVVDMKSMARQFSKLVTMPALN